MDRINHFTEVRGGGNFLPRIMSKFHSEETGKRGGTGVGRGEAEEEKGDRSSRHEPCRGREVSTSEGSTKGAGARSAQGLGHVGSSANHTGDPGPDPYRAWATWGPLHTTRGTWVLRTQERQHCSTSFGE